MMYPLENEMNDRCASQKKKGSMKINTSLSSLAQVQIIVNFIPREVKSCPRACNCAHYSEVIPISLHDINFTPWKYQREYRASYQTMPTKIPTTTNRVSSASFFASSASNCASSIPLWLECLDLRLKLVHQSPLVTASV